MRWNEEGWLIHGSAVDLHSKKPVDGGPLDHGVESGTPYNSRVARLEADIAFPTVFKWRKSAGMST
jgi:hypothetical protein